MKQKYLFISPCMMIVACLFTVSNFSLFAMEVSLSAIGKIIVTEKSEPVPGIATGTPIVIGPMYDKKEKKTSFLPGIRLSANIASLGQSNMFVYGQYIASTDSVRTRLMDVYPYVLKSDKKEAPAGSYTFTATPKLNKYNNFGAGIGANTKMTSISGLDLGFQLRAGVSMTSLEFTNIPSSTFPSAGSDKVDLHIMKKSSEGAKATDKAYYLDLGTAMLVSYDFGPASLVASLGVGFSPQIKSEKVEYKFVKELSAVKASSGNNIIYSTKDSASASLVPAFSFEGSLGLSYSSNAMSHDHAGYSAV